MNALWTRLTLNEEQGAIYDGTRRYLMMRPDVLMGMIASLPATEQVHVLQAWMESAYQHGGKSVKAYQTEQGKQTLIKVMEESAAALGWGKWQITLVDKQLKLIVHDSPFAAGAGDMTCPVCAPISGIFRSLAEQLLGCHVLVEETMCQATGALHCHFIARSTEENELVKE